MLRVDRLSLTTNDQTLVSGLELVVAPGERLAVIGRSGAGKTRLLRTLAGDLNPEHGTIEHRPAHGPPRTIFVAQEPVLFLALSVFENIVAFRRSAAITAPAAPDDIEPILESLDLASLRDKLCGEISGGEQQRAALARAVAVAPTMLLVDEPTARQDAEHRELVVETLTRTMAAGVLVVATHDPEVAARCDTVISLDRA